MSYCSEGARSGGAGAGEGSVTLRWRKRLDNGVRRVPTLSGASVPPDRAAGPRPVLHSPNRS